MFYQFKEFTPVAHESSFIHPQAAVTGNVIMDNVELGDECIVGALSFIKADEKFLSRSLIVGNPAKKIKEVTDEMIAWKTDGTKLYQSLPDEMMQYWRPCEPLRELLHERPQQEALYKLWNSFKKKI